MNNQQLLNLQIKCYQPKLIQPLKSEMGIKIRQHNCKEITENYKDSGKIGGKDVIKNIKAFKTVN